MINLLLMTFIKIFTFPFTVATAIFFQPVSFLINQLFPNIIDYRQDFLLIFQNYFIRGIDFAREVFLNVTHFPRPLFYIMITYYASKVGLHFTFLFFRFLVNLYFILRGTKTIKS